MKKKILYTATSDIHINIFHVPYLKMLKAQGHEVHLAVEQRRDIKFPFLDKVIYLPFKRNPLQPQNYNAYKGLKKTITEENYDLIHCHTPAVAALTRLAARGAHKKGTKVLYTAHGYHFYKGAPLKYWLIYYPVEKLLSYFTDGIILINEEDYLLTKNHFWCQQAFYIKGIGIDRDRLGAEVNETSLALKKKEIGINENDFLLLYIAEFIPRKNHEFLIRSAPKLIKEVPNVKLLFAGVGVLYEKMKTLAAQLGVSNHVKFLGWRDDIAHLASLAHVGISSSRQEGLGLGLAEEMLFSLPIVATQDRGHKEMIVQGHNGYLFEQENEDEFVAYVKELYQNEDKRKALGEAAYKKSQEFVIANSLKSMESIYDQFL